MLVERTVDPEELRLVVAVPALEEPADRVVRAFWFTVPVERVVRVFWSTPLAERVVEPVLRLTVELELPVDRLVRVFWLMLLAERVLETPEERLTEELPVERLVVAAPLLEEPEERLVWVCMEAERDGAAVAEALP